ncbi:MAG: hypothetical protein KKF42_01010, partial [Actinobacteria bacterium]|nr:hypothetical protein [Actinomycetota bacterium]
MSREPRVAVYFDFDNIVISRYDQINGRQAFRRDFPGAAGREAMTPEVRDRLRAANVSIDAVLDYAATFGALAVCRAYADWSHPVNASYRGDL